MNPGPVNGAVVPRTHLGSVNRPPSKTTPVSFGPASWSHGMEPT